VAAGWAFDTGRFAEEVFRPVADGWDVQDNLFRVFQLPLDVADDAVVDEAIRRVDAYLKKSSLSGAHLDTAATLRHVTATVAPQMRETARRAEHRREVLARRDRFAEEVRGEMRGMPALRVAELETLVVRSRKRFSRREVEEALDAAGVEVRDPVPLEVAAHPPRWQDLRQKLRRLSHPTLAAYLAARNLTEGATAADVARQRENLNRTGSGELLRAEQSVLAAVERLVTQGSLLAALRRELVDELTDAAEQGVAVLDAVLDRPGVLARAQTLGLPRRADLAYAVLCRARPLGTAQSTWRADYDQAVAAHDLRAEADVLLVTDDGFAFGDDHTATTFASIEEQLRDLAAVPSTLPTAPLRAATFFIGTGSDRRLVYVYDAAGEYYLSSDRVSGLRFLGSTAGMLLVVDPFSLAAVRTRMEADDIALPPHSTSPPDDVVSRIADGLREQSVGRRRDRIDVRVAVVVTKCDVLIDRGPVPHPYETVDDDGREARSAAVARWLDATAGEGGLVRQLANQYAEIGYFAVSALDAFSAAPRTSARTGRDVHNDPPSAPLRWLLSERTAA
jgi:hypothetical protein